MVRNGLLQYGNGVTEMVLMVWCMQWCRDLAVDDLLQI
jgi:hypothetical protein